MSGGSMWCCKVECLFYKRIDKNSIICEGVAEDSCLITSFRFKKGMDQQMRIFCCEHYKNCEIYRMLMDAKYEE